MFKKVDPRQNLPKMEEDILNFWEENKIFEKSVSNREGAPLYSFYDGPPFATGLPHHGHLLASTSKDVVPRFWTMKGFQVPRRWGWDTHGLPIENIVEKKLGYSSKKEIEENIGKFNAEARNMVLKFADEWKKTIRRIGRWVDFDNSYKTMDASFMESVWWGFKELHKKDLVYKDSRISLFCPRCSTPLSNFEIAMDNSYQDDKDVSVYVKMKVKGEENTYFLVWTTTPWTLPANVALAVGKDIDYVKIKNKNNLYILAKIIYDSWKHKYSDDNSFKLEASGPSITNDGENFKKTNELHNLIHGKVIEEIKGKDLIGQEYEPIFPHNIENGYRVIAEDFVTTEDGTGIVHIAPAFGEDDFNARKKNNLPMIENVDDEGKFTEGEWARSPVWEANFKVVAFLRDNGFLFRKENIVHSYPHCYRCQTKLIYKAQPAWFVKVSAIREKLLKQNEKISWHPAHLQKGRFGNGLETAPDWNVSRSRYWGNPMPIWECEDKNCGNVKILGSYKELEDLSGQKLSDYHRPFIDEVVFKCEKCKKTMRRIQDVFDCWVESGSMPFAEFHYPFENKELFEKRYPAQFISEYIAQTRGWFYTLHVLSVGLFDKPSFVNAVTTGTIAGSDGKKMSKSLGNFTDPNLLIDKFGADAFRFYLMHSPLMEGENLNFSDKELEDLFRGMFRMLWNTYSFFVMYANIDGWKPASGNVGINSSKNLLDHWIISEMQMLLQKVNENMEKYELTKAARLFPSFIDNLSNWYIRRSRKRFWKSENDSDKNDAYETLHYVLVEFSKALAPFCPFVAEEIFRNLTSHTSPQPSPSKGEGEKPSPLEGEGGRRPDEVSSVHLEDFPVSDEKLIDEKLNKDMNDLREIITLGLQDRAKNGIKVRQPLAEIFLNREKYGQVFDEMINKTEWSIILREELNVRGASLSDKTENVMLDTEITPELKLEGQAREIIRFIQEMRKEAEYEVDNHISVCYSPSSVVFEKFGNLIAKETLADEFSDKNIRKTDLQKDIVLDGEKFTIGIKKT